jgi:hypothetical protein
MQKDVLPICVFCVMCHFHSGSLQFGEKEKDGVNHQFLFSRTECYVDSTNENAGLEHDSDSCTPQASSFTHPS